MKIKLLKKKKLLFEIPWPFHDFSQAIYFKFHDFSRPGIFISEFHDFSRFPWPVRTLKLKCIVVLRNHLCVTHIKFLEESDETGSSRTPVFRKFMRGGLVRVNTVIYTYLGPNELTSKHHRDPGWISESNSNCSYLSVATDEHLLAAKHHVCCPLQAGE